MVFERLKQMVSENTLLKVLLGILVTISILFYLKTFYTVGANFDDTFLTKRVISNENHYTGKNKYGDIHITVIRSTDKENSVDVIYNLPNNINRKYTVNLRNVSSWEADIQDIEDGEGNLIFHGGKFKRDVFFLIDQYGNPLLEGNNVFLKKGKSPYDLNYKVTLHSVASFAAFANDAIRGDFKILGIAIFIFIVTLIDMKSPLFFFTLRHSIEVKDPVPSDIYINYQRISWYVAPIIIIILLIAAIY